MPRRVRAIVDVGMKAPKNNGGDGTLAAGAFGVATKVSSTLASLITVPVLVAGLGVPKAGSYYTLIALVPLMNLAGLGVGSSLITRLAKERARDDGYAALGAVRGAERLLRRVGWTVASIALCLVVATQPALKSRGWSDVGTALLVLVAVNSLSLPLGIGSRILFGLGRPVRANQFAAMLSVLQATVVISAVSVWPTVTGAVLGFALPQLFIFWLVLRQARRLLEGHDSELVTTEQGRTLVRKSIGYWAIEAIGYASFQLDTLVIASRMSTSEVTRYAVGAKYLLIVPATLAFFLTPLWAKYSHLLANGQLAEIRRSFLRSIRATVGVSALAVAVLVAASSTAFNLWSVESDARPSLGLLLALGSLVLTNAIVGPQAILLNGVGAMRFQVATGTLMAISNVSLSLLLVGHIGAAGPVLASSISLLVLIALPNGWYLRYRLFRTGGTRDASDQYDCNADGAVSER